MCSLYTEAWNILPFISLLYAKAYSMLKLKWSLYYLYPYVLYMQTFKSSLHSYLNYIRKPKYLDPFLPYIRMFSIHRSLNYSYSSYSHMNSSWNYPSTFISLLIQKPKWFLSYIIIFIEICFLHAAALIILSSLVITTFTTYRTIYDYISPASILTET